jgi:hypothetical protein
MLRSIDEFKKNKIQNLLDIYALSFNPEAFQAPPEVGLLEPRQFNKLRAPRPQRSSCEVTAGSVLVVRRSFVVVRTTWKRLRVSVNAAWVA